MIIGSPASHFGAHQLDVEGLASGDELHLGGDDAGPGPGELGGRATHRLAGRDPRRA
jgi:hypothetical protein